MKARPPASKAILAQRQAKVTAAAEKAGLLEGTRASVGARIPPPLLEAAKRSSGLNSTTDVIEYALAKLALEDEFGTIMLSRKGKAPKDFDLEL